MHARPAQARLWTVSTFVRCHQHCICLITRFKAADCIPPAVNGTVAQQGGRGGPGASGMKARGWFLTAHFPTLRTHSGTCSGTFIFPLAHRGSFSWGINPHVCRSESPWRNTTKGRFCFNSSYTPAGIHKAFSVQKQLFIVDTPCKCCLIPQVQIQLF